VCINDVCILVGGCLFLCLVFRHLREMSSHGKSGSFFYLTQDDRFVIKTLKKSEVKVSC
jgi:hypothetical protein